VPKKRKPRPPTAATLVRAKARAQIGAPPPTKAVPSRRRAAEDGKHKQDWRQALEE
jgi:hypothetical protein